LLDNRTFPSVIAADGSEHPIEASATLVGHPDIKADLVPSFSKNLIGFSPVINNGGFGIIHNDTFMLLENSLS
jgi:hypothetical protein